MIANTITLSGSFRQKLRKCGASLVYPGMLIKPENTTDGAIPHPTAGAVAERAFAIEDALQGNSVATPYNPAGYSAGALVGSTAAILAAYPADPVIYRIFDPGAEVNALLAPGYVYTRGEVLVSAGNGELMPQDTTPSFGGDRQAIAVVLMPVGDNDASTAIDLSATGAVATLNPVRLL